jgi:hypothetical protein
MRAAREPPMIVMLVVDEAEVVLGRVDVGRPDLALVDLLLRLRLEAARCGATVRLRDVPAGLRELLELAGVAGLLGLEPRREPEVGEHRGIDDVVQPRDAPG